MPSRFWNGLFVSSPERSPVICFTNILTRDHIVPGLEKRLRETIEIQLGLRILFATVFVDTRLWKTKHPWKRFQNFRESCVLLTDWIEIHQLQPPVWPSNFLYVMQSGCDWWISIRSVWRLSPLLALLKKTRIERRCTSNPKCFCFGDLILNNTG